MRYTGSRAAGTIALLAMLFLACAPSSVAGSSFSLRGVGWPILAKNHDDFAGEGILLVTPRGRSRVSAEAKDPHRWISIHGSVTFHPFGRGGPTGGINEVGLVVESMTHESARYAGADRRPAVNAAEWVQFQLDRSSDVDDVLASDAQLRIESELPLHYLVADRTGQVAVVEFLDGRMVAREGSGLREPVLTEATYGDAVAHLDSLDSRGAPAGDGNDSLSRFARAARALPGAARSGDHRVDRAFSVLDEIAQGRFTQWSIVYEPAAPRLHFRTRRSRGLRKLELEQIDFDCALPVRALDLKAEQPGDTVSKLQVFPDALELGFIGEGHLGLPFLTDSRRAGMRLSPGDSRPGECAPADSRSADTRSKMLDRSNQPDPSRAQNGEISP